VRERKLGIVALAALIVVDLVLIAMALRSGTSGTTAKVAADVVRPSIATDANASANASPSSSSPTAGDIAPALLTVLNGDDSLFAVKPGACGFGGASGFLQNQATGATSEVTLPVQVAAAADSLSNGTDYVVGSSPECADIQFYAKEGDSWGNGLPLAEIFALIPRDTGLIITPQWGVKESPCPAISLTEAPSGNAFVLCRTGQVQEVTADGFTVRSTLPGGLAIVAGPATTLYAAARVGGCNGIALMNSADTGATWTQRSCISGAATDGSVGIAQRDSSVAVVDSLGKVYRSSDNGTTFLSS
jgi:hypothetical protein